MRKSLLIIIAILISINSYGQNKKLGFWENIFTKKKTTLRFKQINHNIVIPARVNDSDTLWFILDSGLGTSLITELTPVDTLTINYAKKIKLHGLGQGKSLEAYSSHKNNIYIDDIHFKDQDINVLLQDIFYLSRKAGTNINGIIGASVFERFIVDIDYANNEIDFIKPEYYEFKKKSKTVCLPLELTGHKPYIRTWITDSKGKRTKVKLLVDTGASLSLWLQENNDISIPEKNIYNMIGQGLNGDIYGHVGRIKNIEIGHYKLNQPVVNFPDTTSINMSLMSDHRNGSIGGDLLRRFFVTIDYPNKRICFRRNRNYKKPFNYNNSGISIETPYPGLSVYIISHIMKDSPAEKAGLEEGDQIMRINNNSVNKLNLTKIYKTLSSTRNKKIRIKISREGKIINLVLLTKKMI